MDTSQSSISADSSGYASNAQKWFDKGYNGQIPSYNGVVSALRFIPWLVQEEIKDRGKMSRDETEKVIKEGIEGIFNETGLRRYEFLGIVFHAINHAYLDASIFDVSPIKDELNHFKEKRNTALSHKSGHLLMEHIVVYSGRVIMSDGKTMLF